MRMNDLMESVKNDAELLAGIRVIRNLWAVEYAALGGDKWVGSMV